MAVRWRVDSGGKAIHQLPSLREGRPGQGIGYVLIGWRMNLANYIIKMSHETSVKK